MTKDEALKLALDALERCVATCFDPYAHEQVMGKPEHFVNQTITAIKEALAQPEQEPVAFASHGVVNWIADKQFQHEAHLYSAPQRTWAGLTRTELIRCGVLPFGMSYQLYEAIDQALKDKNT